MYSCDMGWGAWPLSASVQYMAMVEEAGSPPIAISEPLNVAVVGLLVGISSSG